MEIRVGNKRSGVDFRVPVIISLPGVVGCRFLVCVSCKSRQRHSIQQRYSIGTERKFSVQMVRCPKLFQFAFLLRSFSFSICWHFLPDVSGCSKFCPVTPRDV